MKSRASFRFFLDAQKIIRSLIGEAGVGKTAIAEGLAFAWLKAMCQNH
jgi:predicted ATPase